MAGTAEMACAICGAELPEGALFCGECGSSVSARPASWQRGTDPRPNDTTIILPLDRSGVRAKPAAGESAVVPERGPASFTLTFSTGEIVTVSGTGLIGRRPLPQPGEYLDHLVQIVDEGMSVSKTHLEFGQQSGQLWISDRYSGNGSVIRRPGEAPFRCEPGRRYLVARGTRVDIAEQFLTIA
ncbi:zinc-ribbon domain-containing protein [Compostimonas suwonensis]|uniref:FHA domain-containing protein n=1 Tax=Compostimonas suwonensis TaxID=1048394 RepID=A0A2M9BUH6_9MICO|nr:zinc-ribbon domain-containing protein [Compostimonas suwonensis]PJJ61562.1 hypothetical protein CLV54_2508 [Compostimonas suwonensis]